MFKNFEREFWAYASAALTGAIVIRILMNPAGLRAAGETATGFVVQTTGQFLRS